MLSSRSFLILVVYIGSCFCQEEFRCKPKPGCQIAQCDPFSARWTNLESDFTEQLEKEEFPITCVGKRKISNQEELNNLKKEMNDVRHLNTIRDQRIFTLESEKKDLKTEISEFRQSNKDHEQRFLGLESENKNLKKKIAETDSTILSLQTAFQRLQSENTILRQDIQTLKKTKENSKCKDGDIYYGGFCFWTDIYRRNFAEWELKCKNRKSAVGNILDSTHFNIMIHKLREAIPSGRTRGQFWLGLRQNPSTGYVTVKSTGLRAPFLKWGTDDPDRRLSDTNVFLLVHKDPSSNWNGMIDVRPSASLGVICQYKSS